VSYFLISLNGITQYIFFLVLLLLMVKPLGSYMARVYSGQFVLLEHILGPIEDLCYKIARIDPQHEMTWKGYANAVLISSFGGFLLLFAILRFQIYLPLNPQHFPNLSDDLAFNTAVSFITNTNWQAYGGENTLSYFSQMIGLTVQNFLSASMGMAVAVAFTRGISRRNSKTIGNFWVDWMRGNLYILLPLSVILAILLGGQGVIQNFKPYVNATLIESIKTEDGSEITTQTIPQGPVASQVAIKQLGTNGGGFFNTNSAHPFENPTPFSNYLELLAIVLIAASLCYTFGVMVNDKRQGWAILITMVIIFIPLSLYGIANEQKGNPRLEHLNIDQQYSITQSGGNMEGKELRFGIVNSALWASATTATSNGSVNSMHDSYTPLGGLIPLIFLLLSEVIFGGVGSGLYGILLFVFITVFISGLMVGRTPEYLGKKIQAFEIKMASIGIFVPVMILLFGTAVAVLTQAGVSGIFNPGPQGFSEILYAFASASGNNGSTFAGLNANTPFYNTILGIGMLFGRFWIIIPVLAIAGAMAEKNTAPTYGTSMSTHTILFISFLIGVIFLVGLLTYLPAVTLAPISEYFHLGK
jgi:K+-transporting ATPase ATPase A chain